MGMTSLIPVIILLFLSSSCQSDDQLTQAKPLLVGDTLISSGGAFALAFFSPTNSSGNLYIGIWYHNIPDHSLVWVANRDSPITTSSSAKLAVAENHELVLSDAEGRTLWTTANDGAAVVREAGAVIAVLLDSGNFVLQSANGTVLWQSFDHPSSTVLPTMRVLLSSKGHVVTRLHSWKGPTDPATGDFTGGIDPGSYLQFFLWNRTRLYCRFPFLGDVVVFGSSGANTTSVAFNSMDAEGNFYYRFTVPDGSPYTRLVLEHTGKMKFLSWNNGTSSWSTVVEHPSSSCNLYASCGPFGYCDSTEAVPACRCLDGFEPMDGQDFSRGCRRKEALTCSGKQGRFVAMPGMVLPDSFVHVRNRSFDQCVAECSTNCSCTAYAFVTMSNTRTPADTSKCLVWTGDLIDAGKKTGYGESLYLRLADADAEPSGMRYAVQNKSNTVKILLPTIACLLLLAATALAWTCKYRVSKQRKKRAQKRVMQEYLRSTDEAGDKNLEFPFINFEDIVLATDNFSESNVLGKGGFGKVYKGRLEDGEEVAVKRLSKGSVQGTQEFRNEVVLIAKLQHKNLVKLLGYCTHEDERLLVYEYLPNKSLDYFIFDSARKLMLRWPTRRKIIQGVARGILYLHQDSRLTIIHRDLKTSNILLDEEMSPKISDFGMARICCGEQHQSNTNHVVGTYGYMAREYAMEGSFSVKSDTYSFGVVLLEIVSGLKINAPHLIMDFPNLISYAWHLWKEGRIEALLDSSLEENCSLGEVSRCIHIGLLCVQDSPSCRPLMSEVVFMLENKTSPLPLPEQPVYFAQRGSEPGKAVGSSESSMNSMSLTALEGR